MIATILMILAMTHDSHALICGYLAGGDALHLKRNY